jgi:organic radical activating enzyme
MNDGQCLPLAESFYSLQGEGFYSGTPAYFIRLAGCNVRCRWCDSKETWDAHNHPSIPIATVVEQVLQSNSPMVVVTGGEPLLHNLDALCIALKKHGIAVHLETSGTEPLSGMWDWIALSPKKHLPPLPAIFSTANELKMVIAEENDFEWAEHNALLCNPQCCLFLQPEWSISQTLTPLIVEYMLHHPKWRLSLQMHKFIGVR